MKNYWIYFVASLISLVGSNFFIFTHGWYLLALTGQKTSVGLTWSLFFLPSLVCLPIVGKLFDSMSLKKLLLSFELLKVVLLIGFSTLLTFHASPLLVYTLAILYGVAFVPYYPSVYVAVKRFVPSSDETRYSHLSETSLQIANVVAVFAAGFLYQRIGFLSLCFIAAACVGVGALGMWQLKTPQLKEKKMKISFLSGYRDVARLFFKHDSLSSQQFLFGVFHQLPQAVILAGNVPIILYVSDVMHQGPKEYGVLDSLIGVAALGVSLLWSKWHEASRSSSSQIRVTFIAGALLLFTLILPPQGLWPYLWMLLYGAFLISSKILARATVVRVIPPSEMGIYSTFFQTCGYLMMMALFLGTSVLSQRYSPTLLFALLGACLLVYSAFLSWVLSAREGQIPQAAVPIAARIS